LAYAIVSGPAHGSLQRSADSFIFAPAANFNGEDNFTFEANDGQVGSNVALVSVSINPVNDVPIAMPQNLTEAEDTLVPITLAGSDVDDDSLTFTIASSPTYGTLSGTQPNLLLAFDPNFNGTDHFSFKANDGASNSDSAAVGVTVVPVNDAPIANSQLVTTREGMPVQVTLSGIDADDDALTYTVVSGPDNGRLTGVEPILTYAPNVSFSGVDSFSFKASDGATDSTTATVTIAVTDVSLDSIYLPLVGR
jgi:hypothetical protein